MCTLWSLARAKKSLAASFLAVISCDYARSHVNADNQVTSHRSEILPRTETQTGLSSLRVSCKRALSGTTFQSCLRFQTALSLLRVSSRVNVLFGCKIQIHRHLFFDHDFNFWGLKLKCAWEMCCLCLSIWNGSWDNGPKQSLTQLLAVN